MSTDDVIDFTSTIRVPFAILNIERMSIENSNCSSICPHAATLKKIDS